MREYGIIFMHHNRAPITLDHFERAKAMNPGVPIFPVSGGEEVIDGGIKLLDIHSFSDLWQVETDYGKPGKTWGSPDLGICQWYSQLPESEKCERYAIMEWDTKCCMSWKQFWRRLWNWPACGTKVFHHRDFSKWYWFSQMHQLLPTSLHPIACGIYPFGALLLSNNALQAVTRTMRENYFQGFSEMRLGTLLMYNDYCPVALGPHDGKVHHDSRYLIGCDTDTLGIWHPVKNFPVEVDHPTHGRVKLTHLLISAAGPDGIRRGLPALTEEIV